ncbi:MAG: glycosyltransferase, partial [Planctomycetes bacterium]|nr:glycosyltransferase [Planctomycetota bacterium]
MQVLFVAIGSSGDVHPLIGIGLAVRARGHDVTIAASAHFESLVRDVGLEFSALG